MSLEAVPPEAAQIRDLIKMYLKAYGDAKHLITYGGGYGAADMTIWIGGVEYHISVYPMRKSYIKKPKLVV